ncbi:LysR family transcriptional regulator [Thalassovita aquimarina]|uniref:LysR family transcriptional regulator n=1 Tax=Thalassovita aquimarina TaxID=2785917 RepID=A0ABS5HX48_9RHOB|nr:LysR family transcriptional regulator [Thalassovita aquimarina]MBR9653411.1 LysR family transcriptional regulator [Thalassovita aquimarina]
MQDWDTLRYVLAIVREGGLSGAARALGVNHATVSRQLDKAEAAAGTQLFTRLATGLVPTGAGQEAAQRAAAMEAEVLALDLALAARDERATGKLTVTVPPLITASGFAEDVAAYRKTYPGVDLRILGDNQILDLHRREADIAIRVSSDPAESLWGRAVTQQRAGWFATSGFIERHAAALRGDGTAVPVISFTGWADPVPKGLLQNLPGSVVALTTDDMVSAVALAETGAAMVRMPHFLGARHAMLGRVPGLPLVDYLPIWILTHPDLRRVPRVAEFMRIAGEGFAARRPLYLGSD